MSVGNGSYIYYYIFHFLSLYQGFVRFCLYESGDCMIDLMGFWVLSGDGLFLLGWDFISAWLRFWFDFWMFTCGRSGDLCIFYEDWACNIE